MRGSYENPPLATRGAYAICVMVLGEPRVSCTQLPLAVGASKNVLVLPSKALAKVLPALL